MWNMLGTVRTVLRVIWPLAGALLLLSSTVTAHAETIVYATLNCSLDDGSLAGTQFTVSYSYDADQVAPEGESYVPLNSFDFQLGDAYFTRDWILQGGQVIFRDGVIQNVTASFQQFMPPNSPVQNITFGFGTPAGIGYIDNSGQFGNGSFTFA
jgi:hypothetical protein